MEAMEVAMAVLIGIIAVLTLALGITFRALVTTQQRCDDYRHDATALRFMLDRVKAAMQRQPARAPNGRFVKRGA